MWFRQGTPEHQSSHVCTRSGEAALGTSYISGEDSISRAKSQEPPANAAQAKDRAEVASMSRGVKIALTRVSSRLSRA